MSNTNVETELLGLERQYWQALANQDVAAAKRLTDDPCLVAGAQGVSSLRADKLESMMSNARYKLRSFELDGAQVRMLSDDVAIIAYRVQEELEVEGKPLTLKAADASTWVRRNGRWLCALHTESIVGDPFGRDRGAPAQGPRSS